MKIKRFAIAAVLICALLLLCCCSDADRLDKTLGNITKSLSDVKQMTQSVTVTDGGVTVYTLEKKAAADGDVVNVEISEGKLSADFTLQTTASTSVSDKKTQFVLPVSLSSDKVSTFVLGNDTVSCIVAKDKLASVLETENYESAGDVSVAYTLQKGKLQEMTCSFVTVSSKTVTVKVTCVY